MGTLRQARPPLECMVQSDTELVGEAQWEWVCVSVLKMPDSYFSYTEPHIIHHTRTHIHHRLLFSEFYSPLPSRSISLAVSERQYVDLNDLLSLYRAHSLPCPLTTPSYSCSGKCVSVSECVCMYSMCDWTFFLYTLLSFTDMHYMSHNSWTAWNTERGAKTFLQTKKKIMESPSLRYSVTEHCQRKGTMAMS